MHPSLRPPRAALLPLLALLLLLPACDTAGPEDDRIVGGVDLDLLFAPPTAAEIAAARADWAGRDVSARAVEEVASFPITMGTVPGTARVLFHRVGDEEVSHFGLVLVPSGADPGSLPVIVYAHGGDDGVGFESGDAADASFVLPFTVGPNWGAFAYVIPSFRAEPLRVRDEVYISGGDASPWDRDVDDTLALLNAFLETTPEADADRIGFLGYSRGGGVALLAAARDPRIDLSVAFFPPTDFFGPYVQEVTEDALTAQSRDLPGFDVLTETLVEPLQAGESTIDEVRAALVRRSAVLFVDAMSDVQVHHGTDDTIVAVSQTERLIEAMEAIGRTSPAFESYIYPGGVHNPISLVGSLTRTGAYLDRLLNEEELTAQRLVEARR